ncbi:ribosome silencing factor [Companilactobacillus heilongjiangensis]|uniref:Ribosomal silencing factor RsfS n=1 Tax=Companilactobacillus heilongjiangensis TaxID=1074467 RepID=A0A0K2LD33_9LACO|nr:ribosome silencing factor [Companilactobacillus heilongjiangensis]ALB29175.1 ribosomal silencing factor RsfS [Companilactobacillus heilongjiangensis]
MDSKKIMEIAVKAADEKHGNDIKVLNISEVSIMADYFVIVDASSQRQVDAIVQSVLDKEGENNVEIGHVEGTRNSDWVLIDLHDVVIHVFTSEQRDFYNLEKLWSDAPEVDISDLVTE